MDRAAQIRWAVLLGALTATIAAIFYPVAPVAGPVAPAGKQPSKKPARVAQAGPPVRGMWEPLLADPFAQRRWEGPAPLAPAPVAAVAPQVVAEVVVTPPGPPPLPFQFVGQMNDSAQQVVYLSRGDEALLARAGEVLEGTYKVLAITPDQIEFEHIPTGQKQALVFPSRNN